MASPRRIEKIDNLIREEIAAMIDRELEFPEGTLITITRVQTSHDLHYAVIFVSIMGGAITRSQEILEQHTRTLQQILNKKLRIRPVPKIRFAQDLHEQHRERVEQSLAELKRKKEL